MAESLNRFIALDKPIEDYIQKQQNKITRAKLRRNVYTLVAKSSKQKEETRKVEEIQMLEFILRVKRTCDEDYEPSSLREFSSNVKRFLTDCKYEFDKAKECVEARRTT